MSQLTDLDSLFRRFLVERDPSPLTQYAADHPSCATPCGHEYPAYHRLCDFVVGDRAFRINRCSTCGDRLFICPLSIPAQSEEGVPYDLSGSALARWVERERERPAKEQQN